MEDKFQEILDVLNNRHALYRRSTYRDSAWDEGYVYVIDFGDRIKIGRSVQPKKRIASFKKSEQKQTYITKMMFFHKLFEKKCHNHYSDANITGEYFKGDFDEIVETIKKLEESQKENSLFIELRDTIPKLQYIKGELEEEIRDLDNRFKTRVNNLSYECMKDGLFKEIRKNLTKEEIIKLLSQ